MKYTNKHEILKKDFPPCAILIVTLAINDATRVLFCEDACLRIDLAELLFKKKGFYYTSLKPYNIDAVLLSFQSGLYVCDPDLTRLVPVTVNEEFAEEGNPITELAIDILRLPPKKILSILEEHGISIPLTQETRDAVFAYLTKIRPVVQEQEQSMIGKFKEITNKTCETFAAIIEGGQKLLPIGKQGMELYSQIKQMTGKNSSFPGICSKMANKATSTVSHLMKAGGSVLNEGIKVAKATGPELIKKAPKAIKDTASLLSNVNPEILDKGRKILGKGMLGAAKKILPQKTFLKGATKFLGATGSRTSTAIGIASLAWDVCGFLMEKYGKRPSTNK